jgi:hypothetical protein
VTSEQTTMSAAKAKAKKKLKKYSRQVWKLEAGVSWPSESLQFGDFVIVREELALCLRKLRSSISTFCSIDDYLDHNFPRHDSHCLTWNGRTAYLKSSHSILTNEQLINLSNWQHLHSTAAYSLTIFLPNLVPEMLQQLFVHVIFTPWAVFIPTTSTVIMTAFNSLAKPTFVVDSIHSVLFALVRFLVSKVIARVLLDMDFHIKWSLPRRSASLSSYRASSLLLWWPIASLSGTKKISSRRWFPVIYYRSD